MIYWAVLGSKVYMPRIRKTLGITQKELGKIIGYSQSLEP